ncbi:glycogen synthase GlgA [Pararhizobium sp.]|uniref:glycogen synthase GlgA n=1 Tax=Pararhizobium sp. TaxID=1977563 RepID=UPI00271A934E|nr:glycogen synthase GlgA [Pararhizobium sp.]MDO9416369.1 glycogen synthase GlgA [Pararhizobium sp.]
MNVLSVASEIFPLIKTGGLADVTGSLPKALERFGVSTRTLVPGYPDVMAHAIDAETLFHFDDLFAERGRLLRFTCDGHDLLVLDLPGLYDRPGGPYADASGRDHADNWKRFQVLSFVGAQIAGGLLADWRPDAVHVHDWQSALTPLYMRHAGIEMPSILTVHNLAFQGQFPSSLWPYLGLPPETYSVACLEYHGDISFLKAGLTSASAITTVSPTYAREIVSIEGGMGLGGVLAERLAELHGIVNGIDADVWNPSLDPHLVRRYHQQSTGLRSYNRARLLQEFALQDVAGPVFAVVSRLTWQKGADMLPDAVGDIIAGSGNLIVLGKGDRGIEEALLAAARLHPGRVGIRIGYDEATAHMIHGGADVIIQPSRFEPCGLTQLYALRYGCVPLVARTGGLSETIIDANDAAVSARVATGFQFHPITSANLRQTIRRVSAAFQDPKTWSRIQTRGMKADFSWDRSAGQYYALYQALLTARANAA